jgi:hypothetical protein
LNDRLLVPFARGSPSPRTIPTIDGKLPIQFQVEISARDCGSGRPSRRGLAGLMPRSALAGTDRRGRVGGEEEAGRTRLISWQVDPAIKTRASMPTITQSTMHLTVRVMDPPVQLAGLRASLSKLVSRGPRRGERDPVDRHKSEGRAPRVIVGAASAHREPGADGPGARRRRSRRPGRSPAAGAS